MDGKAEAAVSEERSEGCSQSGTRALAPCVVKRCYTEAGPTQGFHCWSWVMMDINVQGRVENMIGGQAEENGFLTAPDIGTSITTVVNDESRGEVASYGNNLNGDIVRLIANYLHGSDYKHFRSACKANKEVIPKVQKISYSCPWLVFSTNHNYTTFSVVTPVYNNENYLMNLSDLAGSKICFQKDGCLLMTRKHSIFFYNPSTREMVKLPDMDKAYCHSIVSFSSKPTSSDCIVFFMDERNDDVYIDFIKRREEQWSSCIFNNADTEEYLRFLNTAIFHEGAFFCVNYHGTVGVLSASYNSWKVVEKPHETFGRYSGFLVEYLLLVKLGSQKMSVSILKLNFSSMEWVKVESLEAHVLFVTFMPCVSAVAPNSYMKNKIYFPRLHLNSGGLIFYSLETNSYHSSGASILQSI